MKVSGKLSDVMKQDECYLEECSDSSFVPYQLIAGSSLTQFNMANTVFTEWWELEIFSLVVGCFSVVAIFILTIMVFQLRSSINTLKKQVRLQSRLDKHSFFNPTIEPTEELARRGYSMYDGTQNSRPANAQEKDQYFGSFEAQPQQTAYY